MHTPLRSVLLGFSFWSTLSAAQIVVPSEGIKSISHAMIKAKPGDTIILSDGVYREPVFVGQGVTVRARTPLKSIIDARGRGTAVTLSRGSGLHGLEIRNATTGILVRYPDCSIRYCRIVNHRGTGVLCFGLLPELTDNIIAYNRGSGIQARDIRSQGSGSVIAHNTIAYNGNHGILIELARDIAIRDNIIAFNEGLGVRVGEECRNLDLINNNIYGNYGKQYETPSGNISVDPLFSAPRARATDFTLLDQSPCKGRGSTGGDLGVRFIR